MRGQHSCRGVDCRTCQVDAESREEKLRQQKMIGYIILAVGVSVLAFIIGVAILVWQVVLDSGG